MTRKPKMIGKEEKEQKAAKKMEELNCGILPIGDEDNVEGVITDRDIITRVVAVGKDLAKTKISDVMSKSIVCCKEGDRVTTAVEKMNEHSIRRVLVFNKDEKLSGILSLGDVVRRVNDKSLLAEIFSET